MKTILFSIWGICLSLASFAQNQTAIVLHNTGRVQYFSAQSNSPKSIYPGLELQTTGRIRCQKGATAKLLYNGSTFTVTGGRLQEIADIVKSGKTSSQIGFTGRFWSFVTESVQESESTEKLQKHHRRYMGKTSAAIKGYAERNNDIATSVLTSGKLPAASVTFKWRNTAGTGAYSFNLTDERGIPVAQLLTRDTMVTLDLEQLAMDFNNDYQWCVMRGDGKENSAFIPFQLTSDALGDAQKSLATQPDYQTASLGEQRLMIAYQMEQNKCFYNASSIYEQLLASEPNNLIFRKLYATFLARMDMLPEGMQLIQH